MKKMILGLLLSLLCLSGTTQAKVQNRSIISGYLSDDPVKKEFALEQAREVYSKGSLADDIADRLLDNWYDYDTKALVELHELVKADMAAEQRKSDIVLDCLMGTAFGVMFIVTYFDSPEDLRNAVGSAVLNSKTVVFNGLKSGSAKLAQLCSTL